MSAPSKKRGPKPNPKLAELSDRNRDSQRKYYHKKEDDKDHPQSWYVQRKRVYKRIAETGKLPQARTILKYGVKVEGSRVIVPDDLDKPRVVVDYIPPDEPVVHANMIGQPAIVKPVLQGTITVKDSADYLDRWYKLPPRVDTGERNESGDSWKRKYRGIGTWLKKSGLIKDIDTANLAEALNNHEKVIDAIKSMKLTSGENKGALVKAGTMLEKLKIVLLHLDENAGLKSQVSKTADLAYRALSVELGKQVKVITSENRTKRSVYNWVKVMDAIEEHFGKNSMENLFVRLFNEVPVRNDLNGIPFVKSVGEKGANWVWIKSPKSILVHIGKFKTSAGIPAQDYKLSPALCDIIKKNLDERSKDENWSLVPFRKGQSSWAWFQKAVQEAGYPKYPYGETHEKQDTMNGTRHTIATYRNSLLNTNSSHPAPYGSELADKMLHTLGTSEAVYRNLNIFDEGDVRPPLMEPTDTPDGIKFVRVKEGNKWFVGRLVNQLKNKKWVIDFGDSEPEGEYSIAEIKKFRYEPQADDP